MSKWLYTQLKQNLMHFLQVVVFCVYHQKSKNGNNFLWSNTLWSNTLLVGMWITFVFWLVIIMLIWMNECNESIISLERPKKMKLLLKLFWFVGFMCCNLWRLTVAVFQFGSPTAETGRFCLMNHKGADLIITHTWRGASIRARRAALYI